ncbi:Holliday junction branch migration protein RuvA, partial [Candidatus Peregrinibacteria bacterium]|nr:Holliday junction branch migration protein RuvA [Candidatus Peregrinibacteria bacterium]
MIAHLKGKILKKTDKGIILENGNIGYFVHLTNILLSEIEENQEIELFIHTHVKEDALNLYGFQVFQDLDFFNLLISINGIGPKVAMEILSVSPEKLKSA